MNSIPWSGLIGVLLGHIYYFLRDVIPVVHRARRIPVPHYTKAPAWLFVIYNYLTIEKEFVTVWSQKRM